MSLDLRLLPLDHDGTWGYSHTVLSCSAGGAWHNVLVGVPRTPVPSLFRTFCARGADGNPCYGDTQATPFGEQLDCITASQIVAAVNAKGFWDMNAWDKAAWSYILALPPTTRIALFWH